MSLTKLWNMKRKVWTLNLSKSHKTVLITCMISCINVQILGGGGGLLWTRDTSLSHSCNRLIYSLCQAGWKDSSQYFKTLVMMIWWLSRKLATSIYCQFEKRKQMKDNKTIRFLYGLLFDFIWKMLCGLRCMELGLTTSIKC